MTDMDDQKDLQKATDAVGDAFAHLVAVAFKGSATRYEAVKKVELVLAALHGSLVECAIEAAMKKKGE